MILKLSFENQSDIPAGCESLYEEKDGKYVRKDSEIEAVPANSADVTRLNAALKSEREAHKATKTTLTAKEAERAQAVESLETLQLSVDAGEKKVDEGKITELVTARVTTKTAPLNKKIDDLNKAISEKDTEILSLRGEKVKSRITAAVITAAVASKVVEQGHDELTDLATRVMDIDDTGKPITKADCGFTPGLDAAGFLGELKTKRPYLWPVSAGGGAKGGSGGASGNWGKMNMTERGQYVAQHGMDKANALAKSSGYESATALKPMEKTTD